MAVFELVAASLLTTCLSRLAGPRYRIGSLKADFSAPITIGSTVEARAELVGTAGDALRCSLTCTANGAGVVEGDAVLVPVAGGCLMYDVIPFASLKGGEREDVSKRVGKRRVGGGEVSNG